ncbi:hypothetical protein [Marinospirillum insulare]|uniref:Uncharacterized protein n=1 Tax=Marinospirillum insulare TaxID=217169 RepID=A0ABQ5ZYN8_9GAMM|nr:hypothetical protein [Marinospirillum insulare]GLR65089.1 hypothetical protein GCM10007878_25280 [Marinospirillum insulare]
MNHSELHIVSAGELCFTINLEEFSGLTDVELARIPDLEFHLVDVSSNTANNPVRAIFYCPEALNDFLNQFKA